MRNTCVVSAVILGLSAWSISSIRQEAYAPWVSFCPQDPCVNVGQVPTDARSFTIVEATEAEKASEGSGGSVIAPRPWVRDDSVDYIEQFGIRWVFDKPISLVESGPEQDAYHYGRFANGDYWIVGPVTLVAIDPPSIRVGERVMNGSMINPMPGDSQGYDSAAAGQYDSPGWDSTLNVAFGVSPQNPLMIPPNSSLVSTVSVEEAQARPQLKTAAVLTILDAPPPDGSFRPPYCGQNKAVIHNLSDVDRSLLCRLAPVKNMPSLSQVEEYFERPWIDHKSGWTGEYIRPTDNMPSYGRDIHTRIGVGALMLHTDFPSEAKETLLVRYIQLGIDLWGIVEAGGTRNWVNNGGHAGGRKWPILFAGMMLKDRAMMGIGQKSGAYLYASGYGPGNPPPDYVHFGEDDQTFYVTQVDVAATHGPDWKPDSRDSQRVPYTTGDFGLPEWGIRHATNPELSNAWWGTTYRQVAGPPFHGTALAALIMDAKALWNHDAYFDYTDRYMQTTAQEGEHPGNRSHSPFTEQMWDAYRQDYPPLWGALNDER